MLTARLLQDGCSGGCSSAASERFSCKASTKCKPGTAKGCSDRLSLCQIFIVGAKDRPQTCLSVSESQVLFFISYGHTLNRALNTKTFVCTSNKLVSQQSQQECSDSLLQAISKQEDLEEKGICLSAHLCKCSTCSFYFVCLFCFGEIFPNIGTFCLLENYVRLHWREKSHSCCNLLNFDIPLFSGEK